MLRVYHSNRLDVLEALMEFIVERQRLDDPFMPEMVYRDGAVATDDAGAALRHRGQH